MTKQQTSHLLHSLPGSALEVFTAFLKLGLTSFGGPIAHLGHFRRELVEQRGWVSDSAYAQLLGLCQFLPGPASSQLGFSLGLVLMTHGGDGLVAVIEAFYRAGALVFGGGHVVLPLLEETVVAPGWISSDEFLAGYGAAQAVPGPMFTLAAYLGARLPGGNGGILGAAVSLGAIFLPGFLLVTGVLPVWHPIVDRPFAARAVAGVNAAVVGLLGAALYDPVWTSAVRGPVDIAIALVGFTLLVVWRVSAILVVVWCVAASIAAAT